MQYPGQSPTTHLYTADGMRQERTVNGETTGYVWDNQNVLETLGENGDLKTQFTNLPGEWGGLVSGSTPQAEIVREVSPIRQ